MRLSREAPAEDFGIDMTPMIDVVFLLLIFFVTVSELTRIETSAEVTLPLAEQANVEDSPDRARLVINVERNGNIFVLGQKRTMEELSAILAEEARRAMGPDGFSKRSVVIRGDKELKYEKIQDIMIECLKHRIWKLSFAAQHPEES